MATAQRITQSNATDRIVEEYDLTTGQVYSHRVIVGGLELPQQTALGDDSAMDFRVVGDGYPRLSITPNGVLTGTGTAPPTSAGPAANRLFAWVNFS